MKKILLLFLFVGGFIAPAATQNLAYSTLLLPDSLTKNANAVLRNYQKIFTVENVGKASYKVHYVCTVLNKEADHQAVLSLSYSRNSQIKNLDGNLYDAMGNLVTKLKKSHITEEVNEASYEFTDSKERIAKFDYGQYPYTVEFEYEMTSNYMMFYPTFVPQTSPFLAVQSASFSIISPASIPVRYKEVNMKEKGTVKDENGNKVYTWRIKNLPAMKQEILSPPYEERVAIVYTAPNDFEMLGYKGSLESWSSFGKFQNLLNQDRESLPLETIMHIQKLVANAPTKYEKAKRIYEYMQSKTRYVSIQLGIGGWQPMLPETVDKKGYGDCKALSNYMKSMLKAVGIESHYTIIYGGKNPRKTYPDFVHDAFNHIILCVPIERDTVWLECTSQTQPFNFLGDFTDNRYCLLVTSQGGKLAKTPKYSQAMNTQMRQATVKILPTGEAEAKITTTYNGMQTENHGLDYYIHESKETQKKWLVEKHLQMPQFDLVNFDFKQNNVDKPSTIENIEVKLKSIGAKNGKRLFVVPNLMNKSTTILPDMEKRKNELYIDQYDYMDSDTIRYELPEGYHIEGTPAEHNFKTVFGEYKTTVKVEQGVMTYIRTISMRGGYYPREQYKELAEFYRNINKADNTKVVLVKET
jgi:hypothetical protein